MHITSLHKLLADSSKEFSVDFVNTAGEIVTIPRCVCTSVHSAGRTFNVKVLPSGEIRKIIRISVLNVNEEPLYL